MVSFFFFFQAEDGIRDLTVTGVQTCALPISCELFHIDARNVFPRPKGLSWSEAAAFPLTFLTAWRMLTTRARLQKGEKVLVVGAGGGVAVAAISIARHLGARVFATSRSEAHG